MNYFVCVDELLGIETDAKDFKWTYGITTPRANKEAYQKCRIKVSIELRKDGDVFSAEELQNQQGRFGYFAGSPGVGKLLYEKAFLFGKKLRYSVSINENRVKVIVGKTYERFVKARIMNLHALRYVVQDLVSGLLLLNGFATLYCSAVHFPFNSRTALIFAPPNTGKTLTSLRLCGEYGAHFLSEDVAITDGETVWAAPWTSSLRLQADEQSPFARIFNKLNKIIPIADLLRGVPNKSAEEMLGSERIVLKAKASEVIVLEHAQKGLERDAKQAVHKLLALNRYLFHYHKAPCVIAMHYFNPEFSPEMMAVNEKRIIEKLVENTNYLCVKATEADSFASTVYREIELDTDKH